MEYLWMMEHVNIIKVFTRDILLILVKGYKKNHSKIRTLITYSYICTILYNIQQSIRYNKMNNEFEKIIFKLMYLQCFI